MFPGYHEVNDGASGPTAFRFTTAVAGSETSPSTKVLQIDYRALPENPGPIRRVLDELVQIDDDVLPGTGADAVARPPPARGVVLP